MGAPERDGDALHFRVPEDCDDAPPTVPEPAVENRVKAYLRLAEANTLHGPMTALSPHEGLEAAGP